MYITRVLSVCYIWYTYITGVSSVCYIWYVYITGGNLQLQRWDTSKFFQFCWLCSVQPGNTYLLFMYNSPSSDLRAHQIGQIECPSYYIHKCHSLSKMTVSRLLILIVMLINIYLLLHTFEQFFSSFLLVWNCRISFNGIFVCRDSIAGFILKKIGWNIAIN